MQLTTTLKSTAVLAAIALLSACAQTPTTSSSAAAAPAALATNYDTMSEQQLADRFLDCMFLSNTGNRVALQKAKTDKDKKAAQERIDTMNNLTIISTAALVPERKAWESAVDAAASRLQTRIAAVMKLQESDDHAVDRYLETETAACKKLYNSKRGQDAFERGLKIIEARKKAGGGSR